MDIKRTLESTLRNLEALLADEKNPYKWQILCLEIDSIKEVIKEVEHSPLSISA